MNKYNKSKSILVGAGMTALLIIMIGVATVLAKGLTSYVVYVWNLI